MTKKTIALAALLIAGIAAIFILADSCQPTPEEVIKEMKIKMTAVETVRTEAKMSMEVSEPTEETFNMSMVLNSDADTTDPENIRSTGDFDIVLGVEGMQFSLAGQSIAIGDVSYIKMTTIPALPMIDPMFQMMGINISDLKKQWIKIDKDSIKNMFGGAWTPEMEEELDASEEQQAQTIKALQELLITSDFYGVQEDLPLEEINGETAYHYLVALKKDETRNLILEMFEIIGESQDDLAFAPSETESAKFSQDFNDFFDKAAGINAHLWIGKTDKYLYRFELDKTIDAGSFEEGEEGTVVISIAIDFSNFNQPLNITAPEEFKTLDELFTMPDLGPMPGEMEMSMPGEMYYYDK